MIATTPLQWPHRWPRTEHRKRAPFFLTGAKALDQLQHEVRLLAGKDLIVSTNLPVTKYTQAPRFDTKRPDDPGVAVYFTLDGDEVCLPCDRWLHVEDNVRAIGLTVAALRGIDRWGAKEMVAAAFTGFAALPAGSGDSAPWHEVLEVVPGASRTEIDTAYRRLVRQHHPDAGGDHEQFIRVKDAYEVAIGGMVAR